MKKVLVVEDNEFNMTLITDILRHHGYEVIQATDGFQALEMVRDHCPDLILMDMKMPVMDGFEAIRLLRADVKNGDIKIMAVTSFAMPDERQRVMESGADEYIAKPIDTRELPLIVQRMIG